MKKFLLLTPDDFAASDEHFQVIGAFNPATIQSGEDEIVLIARIVQSVVQTSKEYIELPNWSGGSIVTAKYLTGTYEYLDPRVMELMDSGLRRLAFTSYLQVVRFKNIQASPEQWTWKLGATILPQGTLETFGIEDPRITKIDDDYLITYVAVSPHGVATCVLRTVDFNSFERRGVAFVPENKDVVIFPERINGRYWALHRPTPAQPFAPPEIWISASPDLTHWGAHRVFLGASADDSQESYGRIGGGAVPLRIGNYWLIVYHGSLRSKIAGEVGRYVATIALADATSEPRLLAISSKPLFEPDQIWECEGFVPNVVFPTGITQHDDTLSIFYGAADTSIGVIQMSLRDIMQTHFPTYN